MIVSAHQPQYIPWIGYFDKIDKSDWFVFLDTVLYKVREYQNRNRIRIKGKWIWLTVPVKAKGHFHERIDRVEIDNERDWAQDHCKSLQSWYAHAPYFKEYFPFFADTYSRRWERLIDLNVHIIRYLLGVLKINTDIKFESEIGTTTMSTDRIIEICRKLQSDAYLSGSGGRQYLKEEKFAQAGIRLDYQEFKHPSYRQQFTEKGGDFVPYMSVIDLLFNEGPASGGIISGS